MNNSLIHFMPDQKTVEEFIQKYRDKKLNLNPGFQRDSVWRVSDRAKLIDSIMKNYPLPSIFLYKRESDGEIFYDVIDGKQRIESVFMFMGIIKGNKFPVQLDLPNLPESKKYHYQNIVKSKLQYLINGYKFQTIEVSGDFSDIIDLFVRINSTGKALTAAEKRHAKYYNSSLLKFASNIAEKNSDYFIKSKILSKDQISRMKHVELVLEILISIDQGDVINKKISLDKIMSSEKYSIIQLNKLKNKVQYVINLIRKYYPALRETRFKQLSDYYSLAVLFSKFIDTDLILYDKKRTILAWDILKTFSIGVDEVRLKQKKAVNIPKELELHRAYLLTVLQDSDSISQRRNRENILNGLLESLFERKDSKRLFSPEQRRILWHSTSTKNCIECGEELTWDNFSLDHINPYSKGGRSELDNAAIMCRKCNSRKGARKRK